MAYPNLRKCAEDLEKNGHLVRITEEVDPNLIMANIHRRVFDAGGPALLFERVKGSPFQAVSNIYGTFDRTEFIFRDTLPKVQQIVRLKADPSAVLKNPLGNIGSGFTALTALPKKVSSPLRGFQKTRISSLPQVVSWQDDGGAFVTLPQVLTLAPGDRNMMRSNVGMYRIQLSGNEYVQDDEVGMHYQLHRGIGVHHTMYNSSNEPFRASVFIGGPPSHAFAAIMPLPEGLSELTFAGLLGGRRFRYGFHNDHVISCDADFVITGTIQKGLKKPEGPFGDHLGYYSLTHDFPVLKVDGVYHRKDPLWHFTVVGRPPQEDSSFGYLIHKLVGPLLSEEFPGLHEVNAVDAAGVHPLLLAIGSERYMPFREKRPEELLTMANHLLGKGQTTLAKYLFIADKSDDEQLSTHHYVQFFTHMLRRVQFRRDFHFQTKTTIDTLDYSGSSWNAGSKLVVAASGEPIRQLSSQVPPELKTPKHFNNSKLIMPGVLAISGARWVSHEQSRTEINELLEHLRPFGSGLPMVVLCDDATFTSQTINNFLWVTFTRSNPSHDIYGLDEGYEFKHWGCDPPFVIDARIKPHHAPAMEVDPEVDRKTDELVRKIPALSKLGI